MDPCITETRSSRQPPKNSALMLDAKSHYTLPLDATPCCFVIIEVIYIESDFERGRRGVTTCHPVRRADDAHRRCGIGSTPSNPGRSLLSRRTRRHPPHLHRCGGGGCCHARPRRSGLRRRSPLHAQSRRTAQRPEPVSHCQVV